MNKHRTKLRKIYLKIFDYISVNEIRLLNSYYEATFAEANVNQSDFDWQVDEIKKYMADKTLTYKERSKKCLELPNYSLSVMALRYRFNQKHLEENSRGFYIPKHYSQGILKTIEDARKFFQNKKSGF